MATQSLQASVEAKPNPLAAPTSRSGKVDWTTSVLSVNEPRSFLYCVQLSDRLSAHIRVPPKIVRLLAKEASGLVESARAPRTSRTHR